MGSPIKAKVFVTLKPGVLDPQGKAIEHALAALEFDGVRDVRQGKVFDITLEAESADAARERLDAMGRQLLANTVIENYAIEIE